MEGGLINGTLWYMDVVHLLPIVISVFCAVTYMLYPVAGILAEVVWSRYKMMLTATTSGVGTVMTLGVQILLNVSYL